MDKTIELTFKNSKLLGLISIEKVDSEDSGIKLEGAEFKVINSNGEEVREYSNRRRWKRKFRKSAIWGICIIETKAPDGYEFILRFNSG